MSEGKISILIEAINRVAPETDAAIDRLEQLREIRLANQTVVLEEARTMNYLRQVYRAQYATLYDFAGIMRNVGYIGSALLNIHQAQSVAQLRLIEATEGVADAEDRLNALREKGLEDTIYYEAAIKKLEKAKEDEESATRAVERANQDSILAYVGVAAQIALVTLRIGEMIAKAGGLSALITTIAAVGTAAGVAAAVVGGLAGLAVAGPPETPTPMSELLPEGAGLTMAEMLAGKTYEEKFQEWREPRVEEWARTQQLMGTYEAYEERRLTGLTVNQTIYGVDAQDAANKAVKAISNLMADELYY